MVKRYACDIYSTSEYIYKDPLKSVPPIRNYRMFVNEQAC